MIIFNLYFSAKIKFLKREQKKEEEEEEYHNYI